VFSQPNPGLASEQVVTAELGHRMKVTRDLTVDTALFYNNYDRLIQVGDPTPVGFLPPPLPPGIPTAVALHRGNGAAAESYGIEVAGTWRVAENWRLAASYSFLEVQVTGRPIVLDDPEHSHPEQMAQLRSNLNITKDLEFNSALYYVDHITAQGAGGYLRMDLGLTWRPTQNLELAIWGQNLLDRSHREFNDMLYLARPAEVPRAMYVQATVRF
jgi:iron complex outermembrane receptor protein